MLTIIVIQQLSSLTQMFPVIFFTLVSIFPIIPYSDERSEGPHFRRQTGNSSPSRVSGVLPFPGMARETKFKETERTVKQEKRFLRQDKRTVYFR